MPETIRIRPWTDPIIDTLGHDPRSLYVETFWLPTLGPTALLLMRRLAACFDAHPDGAEMPVAETSQSLGLGVREGRNAPLWKSLNRLVQFDLARSAEETLPGAPEIPEVEVRRHVPPVNRRHVRRLPPHLQAAHDEWAQAQLAEPVIDIARRNARRFALTLTELGEDLDAVERTLFAAGFHPALCRETAAWAWEAHRRERASSLAATRP